MQRLLPGCLGAFGRNRQKPGLTIPVAQVGVVSEPSAPLPAEIALPPDAGSFALAKWCSPLLGNQWPCSSVCPWSITLWGEIPEWGRVSKRRHPPTEDLSASCIWSGFLYSCPPHPPFIHIIVFQLAIHPLLVLGSLRGKTKNNSHRNKSVHFQSHGLSSHF